MTMTINRPFSEAASDAGDAGRLPSRDTCPASRPMWTGSSARVTVTGSSSAIRPRRSGWSRVTLTSAFPELRPIHDHLTLFRRERAAFSEMLPMLFPEFDGKYVAVHHGVVADWDESRSALVRRFFERVGDAPVYIGFVGPEQPPTRQLTPFTF